MDATHPIEREALAGPATRALIGVGLGWIALPLLVLAGTAAHGSTGTDWIGPVAAGGIVAAGTGLLIAGIRLGWAGLVAAIGGAISGALLPYLVVPRLLGFTIWDLSIYGEYLPGMVVAGLVAGIGTGIGARSGLRVAIRPVVIVAVGLVVLALWFGFWIVVAPSLARAA